MLHQPHLVPSLFTFFTRCLATASLILFLAAAPSSGQTRATDGATPLGMAPGAPAGSYQLSGFDNVNLFNGHLNFGLSLLSVGGRGSVSYRITLPIEGSWSVFRQKNEHNGNITNSPEPSEWHGVRLGYGIGAINARKSGTGTSSCSGGQYFRYTQTLSRITFTSFDGTEYELRDQLTGGQPKSPVSCFVGFNRGKNFVSADGSAAVFIADADVVDTIIVEESFAVGVSGYLLLPDGTRMRLDGGTVTWVRDRNGNLLSFAYDTNKRVTAITDSLARVISVAYGPISSPGADVITYKGFGRATRTISVNRDYLQNALIPGDVLQNTEELFPQLNGNDVADYNPLVVASVTLPNNKQYQMRYNAYGELARGVLPTGAAVEYEYLGGTTDQYANGVTGSIGTYQIYRRVVERREYPDGGTGAGYANKMTYSRPESSTNNLGYVVTQQCSSSGAIGVCGGAPALLGQQQHFFHGSSRDTMFQKGVDYAGWNQGREYKTETLAADGATILLRVENNFHQRDSISWWTGDPLDEPPNDPRLIEAITTVEPASANLVSKQTMAYDDSVPFNNQNNLKEFDFGAGASGPLLREIRTGFLTDGAYSGTNAHLRRLPSRISIYNAAGTLQAQTTFEYDNYGTADAFHATILTYPRPGFNELPISGIDAGFTSTTNNLVRGNTTETTRDLLNSSGMVVGSSNSYAQYDVVGNVVKAIDPRSTPTDLIVTSGDFSDRFGVPDGEARANSGSSELNGASQYSYAFPTLVTNALGHTIYAQFDYFLGRPVDGEDANGVVSSAYFDDLLDRPKQVIRAANQAASVKSQTTFNYDDVNRTITTTSDRDSFDDPNPLKSQTVYDGLGRTTESRQYETSEAFTTIKTKYDALGRPFQTSNPYRSGETIRWTTSTFDDLGRLVLITTPDDAAVSTAYSGRLALVTDAMLNKRMSSTNALGQLSDFWEITASDSATEAISFPGHSEVTAGYHTSYSYDVLNDLTNVTQGAQAPRVFGYDSLKRLTSATNPESGRTDYEYDSRGNVTRKTDSRGVVTTYLYDALNRNTTVTYTNDPSSTPAIHRYYDGWRGTNFTNIANVKGRLWQTETSGANGSRTTVNSYDELGRPLSQSQQFYVSPAFGSVFTVQRSYDLSGAVKIQTYPSGHIVTYNYDQAGRLGDKDAQNLAFTGWLGDGVARTYSSGITYTSFGAMAQERLGTASAIYNKLAYNSRGQLAEIRESTTANDSSWNRGKLINWYSLQCGGAACNNTDNNGNVRKQETFVPNNDQNTSSTSWYQQYDYDNLNRLQRVHEYTGNTSLDWQQEFVYDRYSNRTIHQTNTFGAGINRKDFIANVDGKNQLGVPSGQRGVMSYDNAGNLTNDTFTSNGIRTYDAENRMTVAGTTFQFQPASYYAYNADGQRVRRNVAGVETWAVYGLGGELLAEYESSGDPATPQKEYGYRNGQLLVTFAQGTCDLCGEGEGGEPPPPPPVKIYWLVADHLGTPRLIFDQTGNLAGLTRHDYLPFGEELEATQGLRTSTMGYSVVDGVRQKFTQYERDTETALDYGQARFYGPVQGRFTSPDPLHASGTPSEPKSWNRYAYCLNSPLRYKDSTGLIWGQYLDKDGVNHLHWYDTIAAMNSAGATRVTEMVQSTSNEGRILLNPFGNSFSHLSLFREYQLRTSPVANMVRGQEWGKWWQEQFEGISHELIGSGLMFNVGGVLSDAGVFGMGTLNIHTSRAAVLVPETLTLEEAIASGLVNRGGNLERVLSALQTEYAAAAPKSMEEAVGVITRATESVGLQPGTVLEGNLAADRMTIMNVGNVQTTITNTGQIIVSRGPDVLLKLN